MGEKEGKRGRMGRRTMASLIKVKFLRKKERKGKERISERERKGGFRERNWG